MRHAGQGPVLPPLVGHQYLEFTFPVHLAGAYLGYELYEDILHDREAGIVVQDVTLAGIGVQYQMLSGRQFGVQGIRVEIPLQLHCDSAQFQGLGITGVQLECGDVPGI